MLVVVAAEESPAPRRSSKKSKPQEFPVEVRRVEPAPAAPRVRPEPKPVDESFVAALAATIARGDEVLSPIFDKEGRVARMRRRTVACEDRVALQAALDLARGI